MDMLLSIAAMGAVFSWAMSKEEVFKDYRECYTVAKGGLPTFLRYVGYIPTCEYCFSFWFLVLLCGVFRPQLCHPGWRGYVLAHGVCWAMCVTMMTVYQLVRTLIRKYHDDGL